MATNTTDTFQNHNGTGSKNNFAISFPFVSNAEVEVTVGGSSKTLGTHYNIVGSEVQFTSGNTPPDGTANVVFTRNTSISAKAVDFTDGSVLTESDLDTSINQILFAQQEIVQDYLKRDCSLTVTGDLVFEGSTDDTNETTLAITNPTADRTITIPDVTGTIVTTGDTGTVTSTMINDGTIVNADVNATAAIAGTKISPDFGSQNITTTGSASIGTLDLSSASIHTTASDLTLNSTGGTVRVQDNLYVQHATDIDGNLNVDGTTTLDGTTIDGALNVSGNVDLPDDSKIKLGTGDDLELYHQSSGESVIAETGTGNLNILAEQTKIASVAGALKLETTASGVNIPVNLNVDGTTTLDGTTVDGVLDVNGSATIDNVQINENEIDTTSGNLTIDSYGGTTTVDDALNVTGITTLQNQLNVESSSITVGAGAGDLKLRKIGDDFFIDNGHNADSPQSNLYIRNNVGGVDHSGDIHIQAKAGEEGIVIADDASVSLYSNGGIRLQTHDVLGVIAHAGITPVSANTKDLGLSGVEWKDIHVNNIKGDSIVTSGTSTSDSKVYSAKRTGEIFRTETQVNTQVVNLVDAVGGFVPLTDEGEIPQLHPESQNTVTANRVGTILSIGLITKTGGYTTANGRRSGTTVTIAASDLTNHSVDATITNCSVDLPENFSVLVETTAQTDAQYAAGPTFKFHRLLPKTDEITTVAGVASSISTVATNIADVNNFADLYQIDDFVDSGSPSAPTTDGGGNALSAGDLAYDSTANVLKVYTGSAWQEATSLNVAGGAISGDITFVDNAKLKLGGSGDLEIYSTGSHSHLDNSTGYLKIRSNQFAVQNDSGDHDYITIPTNEQGVNLHYDNDVKLTTTSTGAKVTGSLGIGISPTRNFHVSSGSTNEVARFESTDTEVTVEFKDLTGTASLKCRDDFRFNSSSAELARITSTGLEVTGTINSGDITITGGQPALKFIDDGANPDYNLYNNNGVLRLYDITNTTDRLVVDSSGNVGINETSPETLLHISNGDADDGPIILIEGSGQNAANNLLGGINFKNLDSSGDGPTITGAIRHRTANSSGNGGYLTFHTHDGSEGGEGSDAVERMRIDSSGNVGLQNVSPQGELHIGKADNTNHEAIIILNNGGATGNEAGIEWRYEDGTTPRAKIHLDASSQDLTFSTANSSRMTIDSGGDVGINNVSPTAKLHIVESTSTPAVKIKSGTSTNQNTHITLFNDNDVPLHLGVFGSSAGAAGAIGANTPFMSSNSSAGLAIAANHASGSLKFGTGSSQTTRMTIDSSGRVLIGTDTEGVSGADELTVNTPSGHGGITIRNANDSNGNIFFSDGTSGAAEYAGYIQYAHSSNDLVFGVNGSTRMYINSAGNMLIPSDSASLFLGADQDLELIHNGSNGFIVNDTGTLNIKSDLIRLTDNALAHVYLKTTALKAVELYYDNDKKFETTSYGVQFTDNVKFDNPDTAGRDLTWEADNDALHWEDNTKATFGAGNDLQIYHDGTKNFLKSGASTNTEIWSDVFFVKSITGGGEAIIKGSEGGGVELYYDNSLKFSTSTDGIQLFGNGYADFPDNGRIRMGADYDLAIYHSGSNASITNDTGDLNLVCNSDDVKILAEDDIVLRDNDDSTNFIHCINGGAVELYHNGSKKLTTTASGVAIYYDDTTIQASTTLLGFAVNDDLIPQTDDSFDLGIAALRWDDVRATNGTIQTSDRNAKENILESDLGLDFINKLSPKSFKFKGKTRTHYGLIAQDVETVITDLGKTTTEFAPLIKDELEDGTEQYGLRYTELISPLIKAVQELKTENDSLKARISALEAA